jgi:hypothetical protein
MHEYNLSLESYETVTSICNRYMSLPALLLQVPQRQVGYHAKYVKTTIRLARSQGRFSEPTWVAPVGATDAK